MDGVSEAGFEGAIEAIRALNNLPIKRIRIVSVRGDADNEQLRSQVCAQWHTQPEFAVVSGKAAGITNSYSNPETMGVDRWCGILAARQITALPYCVASFGSAATLDFVDARGSHCGGYILPGVHLQAKALKRGTDRVVARSLEAPASLEPANNTTDAVMRGIWRSLVSILQLSVHSFSHQQQSDVEIILTGGDADQVSKYLEYPAQIVPGLVLDGLPLLLP
jgi:type III pantothenate kinase